MSTPPAPPRRWFAFRLSTLVLAVWTLPTVWLIVARWSAWQPECKVGRYLDAPVNSELLLTLTDSDVRLWNIRTAKHTILFPWHNSADIDSASFNVSRNQAAFCDTRGKVRVWDVRQATEFAAFQSFSNATLSHFFSDGSLLLYNPGAWELWRVNAENTYRTVVFSCFHFKGVFANQRFAIDSGTLWDLQTFTPYELPESAAGFHDDSAAKAVLADAHGLFVYDPFTRQRKVGLMSSQNALNQPYCVTTDKCVTVSPSRAWDCISGHEITATPACDPTASWSQDRQRLIRDGQIFDAANSKAVFEFPDSNWHHEIFRGDKIVRFDLKQNLAVLWSRRHPEWWWGHFYRPEVWVALLVGALWLLKLRRALARRAAPADAAPAAVNSENVP